MKPRPKVMSRKISITLSAYEEQFLLYLAGDEVTLQTAIHSILSDYSEEFEDFADVFAEYKVEKVAAGECLP